jgi:intracellular septation protein
VKLLADWGALVVFFVTYKLVDLYWATALAVVMSVLMIGLMRARRMPIDRMQWIGLGLIVVFGGLTLLLQDERFIKAKPTLLYGLSAFVFAVPQLLGKAVLLKTLIGDKIQMPDFAWRRLNIAWALFFVVMAVLNAWVAVTFPTDVWVDFKLFGGIGLMAIFIVGQTVYMTRHGVESGPADQQPTEPKA